MIIDIHTHVFPDNIAEKASHGIEAFYGIDVQNNGRLENLLKTADDAGVDKVVIHSPATTPHQVTSINNFIYECTQKYPDRVLGFMTMHPDFENIPKILETPYVPSPVNPKKSYAPYKYEIKMLREGVFDPALKEKIIKDHEQQ